MVISHWNNDYRKYLASSQCIQSENEGNGYSKEQRKLFKAQASADMIFERRILMMLAGRIQ